MRGLLLVVACACTLGCRPKLMQGADTVELPNTPHVTERVLTFTGGGGIKLTGTYMAPEGSLARNYPAVLLLPGSGPTDRDGNQPAFKTDTLRQLAEGLAGAGVASFRFDKRACATVSSQWPKDPKAIPAFFSLTNHVSDVLAAWKTMATYGLTDIRNCAILGHSEGGILALSVAKSLKPKALILIGTPGRPFDKLIHDQLAYQSADAPPAMRAKFLSESDRIYKAIRETGKVPADVPAPLQALYNPSVGVYLKQMAWVSPTRFLADYPGPVLIVNGAMDVQVSPTLDAQVLATVARQRKDRHVALSVVPLASHNLKPVQSGKDPGLEGEVVPDAIDAIQSFVIKHLGGRLPNRGAEVGN
ncbi:MAG: alpha/beta fold hydrolase [Armatimonadetes bacterium]|nr:alpha/beta fold hydrolase [Armatimonadota bacterium]